jgi:hypothetical protein
MPQPSPAGAGGATPTPAGPGTVSTQNQGNLTAALQLIQNAMKQLGHAMNDVPLGSEMHTEILNTLKKFGTQLKQAGVQENHGLQASGNMAMLRKEAAQAPQVAAMRSMFAQPQAPAMPQQQPPPQPAM